MDVQVHVYGVIPTRSSYEGPIIHVTSDSEDGTVSEEVRLKA